MRRFSIIDKEATPKFWYTPPPSHYPQVVCLMKLVLPRKKMIQGHTILFTRTPAGRWSKRRCLIPSGKLKENASLYGGGGAFYYFSPFLGLFVEFLNLSKIQFKILSFFNTHSNQTTSILNCFLTYWFTAT